MTNLAVDDKGNAMAFDGKEWKPAPVAQNDKGERVAFDGKEWRALAPPPSGAVGSALKTADAVFDKINQGINWAGTQFTKAGTAVMGAPRSIADTNAAIAAWTGEKLGAPETGRAVGKALRWVNPNPVAANFGPNTEQLNRVIFGSLGVPEVNAGDNPALTLTNPFGFEGKVNVGKMLDAGAQAIPAAALGAGGVLPNVLGGVTSEAAGQAAAGTPYEIPARIVGALPGAWLGSKATTPLPANLTPQQARAVEIAKETGTPLSVAQETGRGAKLESALARFPTSAGPFDRLAAKQGASTDRAALKTMGFEGDEVGAETMKTAQRQASTEFKAATEMPGTVDLTPKFFGDVKQTLKDYKANTSDAGVVPAVEKNVAALTKLEPGPPPRTPLTATAVRADSPTLARLKEAINAVDDPALAGRNTGETLAAWFGEGPKVPMPKAPPELTNATYQSFRKTVSDSVADLYKAGEPGAAKALQKVRDSLDDAAGASLPAEQMEAWRTARRHYMNFKIIEKAAGRGTVASRSEGTLAPSALTQALRQKQGDAFSHTTGGLNDVATLKQYLADTFPNSGTPTMQAYQALLSGGAGLGAAGLSGAGAFGALAPQVAIPAAAALVAPNLAARAMTGGGPVSNVVRNYLANQALPNRAQSVGAVPFALAPGILTDQRILPLLTDQRGPR